MNLRTDTKINDKYVKEIELRAPIMLPVLGSMVNLIGGAYMTTLMSTRIFALKMNKKFVWAVEMEMGVIWI